MLLWWLDGWSRHAASPAVWTALEKTTLRAALAALVGFLLAAALGPWWIGWLRRRFREPNTSPSPEIQRLHESKHSTPTMGGLFIIAGVLGAAVVFGDWGNPMVLAAVWVAVGLAVVGAVDDLIKLAGRARGLSARAKLTAQSAVALVAAVLIYRHHAATPNTLVWVFPGAGAGVELGAWFIPWAALVIVGSSNAVNLTDGLDGLSGGCLVAALGAMTPAIYASGHAIWAAYLGIPRVAGAGELCVLSAAAIGGVLGFLWFNCHPAQVFMGNTGALPLGGLLGALALSVRQEWLLVVVGGVFVAEALSVILQVGAYRLWRRRVLLCAPLHHHFQLKGWTESKIVVRFWIAAALCAVLGLGCLKAAAPDSAPRFVPSTAAAAAEDAQPAADHARRPFHRLP